MSEKKKTVEEKLSRLEEIVGLMENPETSLDDAIELYKEAALLAKECQQTLRTAELTVQEISFDRNGE